VCNPATPDLIGIIVVDVVPYFREFALFIVPDLTVDYMCEIFFRNIEPIGKGFR